METNQPIDDTLRLVTAERDKLKAELASYSIMGDVSEAISFLESELKVDVALSGAFAMVHGWMKAIHKAWQEQKHELAVRERQAEILAERHNPVYCPYPKDEHTPCNPCKLKEFSPQYQKFCAQSALTQARAELEPKLNAPFPSNGGIVLGPFTFRGMLVKQEAKPEPKFKPGETVTHVEYDNPFVVTTCYWDNGMWWYTTGRALVMAIGEPKLRLVELEAKI